MKEYCVEKLECSCNNCKNVFGDAIPADYELVSFVLPDEEKVFLPTYGENGYLYLLKRLVPEWNEKDDITPGISRLFEERINQYTPYKVQTYNKTKCPKCKSEDITISARALMKNASIRWIKIDTSITASTLSEDRDR